MDEENFQLPYSLKTARIVSRVLELHRGWHAQFHNMLSEVLEGQVSFIAHHTYKDDLLAPKESMELTLLFECVLVTKVDTASLCTATIFSKA